MKLSRYSFSRRQKRKIPFINFYALLFFTNNTTYYYHEMKDLGRLSTLWEYALGSVGADDALGTDQFAGVLEMYLSFPVPRDDLMKACESVLDATSEKTKSAVLNYLKNSGGSDALSELEAKHSSPASSEPQSNLHTIMGADFEDDDEDGDHDGDDVEGDAVPEPTKVVMRGFLKVKGGKMLWTGKWAESAELFAAGKKSRFKYVYVGTKDVSAAQDGVTAAVPLSGCYQGYFIHNDDPVEENNVNIEFSSVEGKCDVSGSGSNVYGAFTLEGLYDPSNRRLAAMKTYALAPAANSDDDEDDFEGEDETIDKEAELAALRAEANMSVEELRNKYSSHSKADDDGEPLAKRARMTA